jgi:metallophosphoesterase (TIGR00282 family)
MRILFLGDIVGRPGRTAVIRELPVLRARLGADMVVANAENASGGLGLSATSARALLDAGADVLTGGNHIWKFKDLVPLLDAEPRLLRPANYPDAAPGRGLGVYRLPGLPPVAVLNLQGRTYMEPIDCPFAVADTLLGGLDADVRIVLADLHAEATSEKTAMGFHLDGRVSALVGTHTHIQTRDARLLPRGTAYITDAGMCGVADTCLGMTPRPIVEKFRTGRPVRFVVAKGEAELRGVVLDIDDDTGRALGIRAWPPERGTDEGEG